MIFLIFLIAWSGAQLHTENVMLQEDGEILVGALLEAENEILRVRRHTEQCSV